MGVGFVGGCRLYPGLGSRAFWPMWPKRPSWRPMLPLGRLDHEQPFEGHVLFLDWDEVDDAQLAVPAAQDDPAGPDGRSVLASPGSAAIGLDAALQGSAQGARLALIDGGFRRLEQRCLATRADDYRYRSVDGHASKVASDAHGAIPHSGYPAMATHSLRLTLEGRLSTRSVADPSGS